MCDLWSMVCRNGSRIIAHNVMGVHEESVLGQITESSAQIEVLDKSQRHPRGVSAVGFRLVRSASS